MIGSELLLLILHWNQSSDSVPQVLGLHGDESLLLCAGVVREKVYKLGADVAVVEGEPEEAMDTS